MINLHGKITYYAHLFKAIFKQKHQHLKPVLQAYIRYNAIIVDVGAHCGQMAKLFCHMAPNGHVYAFEPGRYAWSLLTKTQQYHQFHNLTLINQGLSNTPQELILHTPIKKSGSVGFGLSSVGHHQKNRFNNFIQENITLTCLDIFKIQNNIAVIDFIKIDIEGHEMKMLKGAINTLTDDKPTLLIEIDDNMLQHHGSTAKELLDFLYTLDYKIIYQHGVDYLLCHQGKDINKKDIHHE